MADTTEARRLAGLLDTDYHEPLVEQAAAAMLLSLADENDALRSDLSRLMEKHNALHINARACRDERDSLRAQVEALRADAERLDWAQTQAILIEDECLNTNTWRVEAAGSTSTGETLRAAIDAARSQEDKG